jgi:hypothetical protein
MYEDILATVVGLDKSKPLNANSSALTGNSARRAGSSSLRRSGRQSGLRREPAPGSVRSSFARIEDPAHAGCEPLQVRSFGPAMFAAAHCWPFSYVDAAVQPRVRVQMMSSCQSISSRRRKPCDPSFEDCQIRRSAITLQWRSIPATWGRPNYWPNGWPADPYVGSQNVDFNIICRSNGFRATARSCLSCWKILVPIAAVRGASPWPSPAVMHLESSPRQDARNCAGADTVSYVRAGCRS